ncbi:MAG: hypothetical protein SGPRY_012756 [Prymnesium sp.]
MVDPPHPPPHLQVYPKGTRLDSSNFSPVEPLSAGMQCVALNYQTHDLPMQLQQSFFRINGGCGYVLKPARLRADHHSSPPLVAHLLTSSRGRELSRASSSSGRELSRASSCLKPSNEQISNQRSVNDQNSWGKSNEQTRRSQIETNPSLQRSPMPSQIYRYNISLLAGVLLPKPGEERKEGGEAWLQPERPEQCPLYKRGVGYLPSSEEPISPFVVVRPADSPTDRHVSGHHLVT